MVTRNSVLTSRFIAHHRQERGAAPAQISHFQNEYCRGGKGTVNVFRSAVQTAIMVSRTFRVLAGFDENQRASSRRDVAPRSGRQLPPRAPDNPRTRGLSPPRPARPPDRPPRD